MAEFNQKKSGRGGKRFGAGRKPGTANTKTREIADKAAKEGITPLEVMLEAMRDAYAKNGAQAAFSFAKDAAPYVHARLASTEVGGKNGFPLEHPTFNITFPDGGPGEPAKYAGSVQVGPLP